VGTLSNLRWSLRLDYIFLRKITDLTLAQRMRLIFMKYAVFLRDKIPGVPSRKTPVTIFKKRFYYDDVYGIASLQRVYCEHYLLRKYVPENAVVIDIGANIGQFNFFARHYLKASRVISIEPVKKCFELLKLNSSEPTDCFHCAVSDTDRIKTIFISSLSSQLSTYVRNPEDTYGESFEIKSIRLDELARENNTDKVHLLKIDTEGSEYDVLMSAGDFLNKVGVITVEMSVFRNSSGNLFQTGSLLQRRGFKMTVLGPIDGFGPSTLEGIFTKV
jgi:FkbM family methyltransferase